MVNEIQWGRMNIRIIIGTGLFFVLATIAGCRTTPSAKPVASLSPKVLPFVPPADSAIYPARMTAWFGCNRSLDSLSDLFTKAIAADNAADSTRKKYSAAQNNICAYSGLPGGYREYCWILDNIGSGRNRPVYDSIKELWKGKKP
jgi:hypothetical protein